MRSVLTVIPRMGEGNGWLKQKPVVGLEHAIASSKSDCGSTNHNSPGEQVTVERERKEVDLELSKDIMTGF